MVLFPDEKKQTSGKSFADLLTNNDVPQKTEKGALFPENKISADNPAQDIQQKVEPAVDSGAKIFTNPKINTPVTDQPVTPSRQSKSKMLFPGASVNQKDEKANNDYVFIEKTQVDSKVNKESLFPEIDSSNSVISSNNEVQLPVQNITIEPIITLQTNQRIGAYRIINLIGRGGMATVYRAYDEGMERYVAIKVLPSDLAHNEKFLARFKQEARTIAKLEHPRIVPVYHFCLGGADGINYLVMRYMEDGSLKDKLRKGDISLVQINNWFTQLAEALDYAHKRGVIHRDLKPANILLDNQDNLFLTDFGIAKLLEGSAHLTHTGVLMGTPAYMSPEQAQNHVADQLSDIYSLGIILYEMITGRVPFEADTSVAIVVMHITAPLTPPSQLKPDLSPSIENILLKALSKEPRQRFATVSEFLLAWKDAFSQAILTINFTDSGQGETTILVNPKISSISKLSITDNQQIESIPNDTNYVHLNNSLIKSQENDIKNTKKYSVSRNIILVVTIILGITGVWILFNKDPSNTPTQIIKAHPPSNLIVEDNQQDSINQSIKNQLPIINNNSIDNKSANSEIKNNTDAQVIEKKEQPNDEQFWQDAYNKNNIAAYQDYLDKCENINLTCKHKDEAKQYIAKLQTIPVNIESTIKKNSTSRRSSSRTQHKP